MELEPQDPVAAVVHEPQGLQRIFAAGVIWTAVERWGTRIVSLATFIVLARLITPGDFGLVALASTFSGLLTVVAEGGITTYVVQHPDLDDAALSSTFWTSLTLGLASAVVLVGLSPVFAELFNSPRLPPVLAGLSATLIAMGLTTVPTGLLQREMAFDRLAKRQLAGVLASAAIGVGLAVLDAGPWALVAQTVSSVGVAATVLWAQSSWHPSLTFSPRAARDALGFGSKVLGINVLISLRDQGEGLVVAGALGTEALGYWTVATRILQILVELGVTVVQTVAVPAFVRIRGDRRRLVAAYTRATVAAATAILPMLTITSALSPHLVPALFGQRWHAAGTVAEVLTLTGVFSMLVNFDQPLYLAIGRPGVELFQVALIVVLHLAVVIVFAQFGLEVLALALLGRNLVTWLGRVTMLRRLVGIRWGAYAGLRAPLAVSVSVGLALRFAPHVEAASLLVLVPEGLAATSVYALVMWGVSPTFRSNMAQIARMRALKIVPE